MAFWGNHGKSNKFLFIISVPKLNGIQNSPLQRCNNHKITNFNSNDHPQKRQYSSCINDKSAAKGKIAIITGGARGIGFSIAEQLLKADAEAVILGDILIQEMEDAVFTLNEKYGEHKALFQPTDVSKTKQMEKLFKCTKERFGRIDVVINNAGILSNESFEDSININIKGMVKGTFLAFQHMTGRGGLIINNASIYGIEPLFASPVYCGASHFVIGFTRSMGHDYFFNATKVKIMAFCPGPTDTKMLESVGQFGNDPMFPNMGQQLETFLKSQPNQTPKTVAKGVISMLNDGENGSIWISKNRKFYKIYIPDMTKLEERREILSPPVNLMNEFNSKVELTTESGGPKPDKLAANSDKDKRVGKSRTTNSCEKNQKSDKTGKCAKMKAQTCGQQQTKSDKTGKCAKMKGQTCGQQQTKSDKTGKCAKTKSQTCGQQQTKSDKTGKCAKTKADKCGQQQAGGEKNISKKGSKVCGNITKSRECSAGRKEETKSDKTGKCAKTNAQTCGDQQRKSDKTGKCAKTKDKKCGEQQTKSDKTGKCAKTKGQKCGPQGAGGEKNESKKGSRVCSAGRKENETKSDKTGKCKKAKARESKSDKSLTRKRSKSDTTRKCSSDRKETSQNRKSDNASSNTKHNEKKTGESALAKFDKQNKPTAQRFFEKMAKKFDKPKSNKIQLSYTEGSESSKLEVKTVSGRKKEIVIRGSYKAEAKPEKTSDSCDACKPLVKSKESPKIDEKKKSEAKLTDKTKYKCSSAMKEPPREPKLDPCGTKNEERRAAKWNPCEPPEKSEESPKKVETKSTKKAEYKCNTAMEEPEKEPKEDPCGEKEQHWRKKIKCDFFKFKGVDPCSKKKPNEKPPPKEKPKCENVKPEPDSADKPGYIKKDDPCKDSSGPCSQTKKKCEQSNSGGSKKSLEPQKMHSGEKLESTNKTDKKCHKKIDGSREIEILIPTTVEETNEERVKQMQLLKVFEMIPNYIMSKQINRLQSKQHADVEKTRTPTTLSHKLQVPVFNVIDIGQPISMIKSIDESNGIDIFTVLQKPVLPKQSNISLITGSPQKMSKTVGPDNIPMFALPGYKTSKSKLLVEVQPKVMTKNLATNVIKEQKIIAREDFGIIKKEEVPKQRTSSDMNETKKSKDAEILPKHSNISLITGNTQKMSQTIGSDNIPIFSLHDYNKNTSKSNLIKEVQPKVTTENLTRQAINEKQKIMKSEHFGISKNEEVLKQRTSSDMNEANKSREKMLVLPKQSNISLITGNTQKMRQTVGSDNIPVFSLPDYRKTTKSNLIKEVQPKVMTKNVINKEQMIMKSENFGISKNEEVLKQRTSSDMNEARKSKSAEKILVLPKQSNISLITGNPENMSQTVGPNNIPIFSLPGYKKTSKSNLIKEVQPKATHVITAKQKMMTKEDFGIFKKAEVPKQRTSFDMNETKKSMIQRNIPATPIKTDPHNIKNLATRVIKEEQKILKNEYFGISKNEEVPKQRTGSDMNEAIKSKRSINKCMIEPNTTLTKTDVHNIETCIVVNPKKSSGNKSTTKIYLDKKGAEVVKWISEAVLIKIKSKSTSNIPHNIIINEKDESIVSKQTDISTQNSVEKTKQRVKSVEDLNVSKPSTYPVMESFLPKISENDSKLLIKKEAQKIRRVIETPKVNEKGESPTNKLI